jgi:hypothetical protein
MTKSIIVKIEIENWAAMIEAMENLVEEHGASFYTLVVDGEPQRMGDRHLDVEEREALAIAKTLRRVRRVETPDPALEDVLGTGPFPDHPIP